VKNHLSSIKSGLALVLLLGLLSGVALGIAFGVNEDFFKDYVAQSIIANPEVHDAKSQSKIWRYAQRAHFHAAGIASFSIGLLLLVAFSGLREKFKKISATLIGVGSFYPFAWFSMFLLAPSIGRSAAHHHIITEMFVWVSVVGLMSGLGMLLANLFLNWGSEPSD